LSAKVTSALRNPVNVGSKYAVTVQVLPAARDVLHPSVREKSPGFAPVRVTLVSARVPVPVLVTVIFCPALFFPTVWVAKVTEVGLKLMPGTVPVPLRLRLWGLFVALSVKVTSAVVEPVACGVKVTVIMQVAPMGTLVPHVFVSE